MHDRPAGSDNPGDGEKGDGEKGYALEPRPEPPTLPGEIVQRTSADDALDALATDLVYHASMCVRNFGDFHLALSGGPEFESLYLRLMIDPAYRSLPWERTHLWIVEEARVGFDDARSAFRQVRETIVEHTDIKSSQTHPIHATEPDAEALYEQELKEALAWREKGHDRLDYVLLRLESVRLAAARDDASAGPVGASAGPRASDPERIGLSLAMINASRFVAAPALGKPAGPGLASLAKRHKAQSLGLAPLAGALRWYVDDDACAASGEPD
jgi:hypothetical protein